MTPLCIEGANVLMKAPPGQEGEVRDLHVLMFQENGVSHYVSRWEPTLAELAILVGGGSVELWCMNGQPPVYLGVQAHVSDEP